MSMNVYSKLLLLFLFIFILANYNLLAEEINTDPY